jgi:predicted small secreted protein
MKKISLFIFFGLFLMTSLTGCNTVHGAGQDVADTGHNIAHAAN